MRFLDGPVGRLASIPSALLVCCFLNACAAVDSSTGVPDAEALLGTWTVDLRPTPDSEPYYQEFVVSAVDGNSFTATFYGTPVSQARINTDWGKLRIAFVTADGSGDYNHSAVLEGDTLEGLSNSTGRDFLSYWSAVKE
ncbi:MAG: hypothetical protein QNI99_04375 [Woeseiaceae bacterium]|nr:hypothetical protein [Woeseiaceae bacterium]